MQLAFPTGFNLCTDSCRVELALYLENIGILKETNHASTKCQGKIVTNNKCIVTFQFPVLPKEHVFWKLTNLRIFSIRCLLSAGNWAKRRSVWKRFPSEFVLSSPRLRRNPDFKHEEIVPVFDCSWLAYPTNLWIFDAKKITFGARVWMLGFDLSKNHMLLAFVLTQCFVVLNLVYSTNIHAQGTTAQYSPTAAWCAIPATCWKKSIWKSSFKWQVLWGNIWKFHTKGLTFQHLGNQRRAIVGFVDDSLACVVPMFHHRNTFKHQHQQKTPKKRWLGSEKLRQFGPQRLWDSEFASVAMWIHFASYHVGIRLHHWSSSYVASFHQTTPSCWRLSGSCNSMITQLFRSWWHKSSCSIGKPSPKNKISTNLQVYILHTHLLLFY